MIAQSVAWLYNSLVSTGLLASYSVPAVFSQVNIAAIALPFIYSTLFWTYVFSLSIPCIANQQYSGKK